MQNIFSHRFLIIFAVFLFIFGFYFVANASTIIFSDGFESDFSNWTGNDSKWDISGTSSATGVHGGSKRAQVTGATDPGDDVLLKNASVSTGQGITLEFWYRIYKGLEDEDHIYVEWTGDGSNWNILNDFTALGDSATWEFASYSIPAEANERSNFAIRFRAKLGASSSDIFYLDDVAVSAGSTNNESTPTPTPDISSTPVPSILPEPSSEARKPTPVSSATPMPPSPTPLSTPASTPTPTSSLVTLKPSVSNIPTPSPSPKSKKQESVELSAIPSPKSSFSEPQPEEEIAISETPHSFSASISNFFNGTKFFWLIATMVLAVVFSLTKPKKD